MNVRATAAIFASLALGSAEPQKATVFMIGDSTMADKANPSSNPERGWGQVFPRFLDERAVVVRNHAANGRSTKRFIDEGRWDTVVTRLRRGDYVIIQFAHNDGHVVDPARYVNAYSGYRRNLERFVADTRREGANPIFFSPVVRRYFNEHGVLTDAHGAYPLVMREVARDLRVPFVDMQTLSEDLVRSEGPERSKALYLWVPPGAYAMYPEGKQDNTHFTLAGATAMARLAALGLARSGVPLGRYVRGIE